MVTPQSKRAFTISINRFFVIFERVNLNKSTNTHSPKITRKPMIFCWSHRKKRSRCEDARIQVNTNKLGIWQKHVRIQPNIQESEYMRMWGCTDACKHAWTSWHKDLKMPGCKQAHMNLRIWWCTDVRMSTSTHQSKGMRMWGCKNKSKHTWTWGYEDTTMQGHTHEPEDTRKEVRLEQSILENTFFTYTY